VPVHSTVGASGLPDRALLVDREVMCLSRGVQQDDPLGPFLFAAGIQAALDALTPGRTLNRWYLDDGVFMSSVAEVEGC